MPILILLAVLALATKSRRAAPRPVQKSALEDFFDQDSDAAEKSLAFISAMQQGRGNLAAQLMPAPPLVTRAEAQAVGQAFGVRIDPVFRFI